MSPEPQRCPPVPGAGRIPTVGPARCSRGGQEASALAAGPRRDSRAPLPSSPQWSERSSALRHAREREGSPEREAPETARRKAGAGRVLGPTHTPGLLPPRSPSAAREGVLPGRLGAFGLLGCPQTAGKGKARRLHLFISPSSQASHPTCLFLQIRPCASPHLPTTAEFPQCLFGTPTMEFTYIHRMPFPVSRLRHFPPKPTPIGSPSISVLQSLDLSKSHSPFLPIKMDTGLVRDWSFHTPERNSVFYSKASAQSYSFRSISALSHTLRLLGKKVFLGRERISQVETVKG